MKIIKSIDVNEVQEYLEKNKDKSIQEVFDLIKSKKGKNRSIAESLVYTYILMNRKKLGIKWLRLILEFPE